jgi:hypothetical protein
MCRSKLLGVKRQAISYQRLLHAAHCLLFNTTTFLGENIYKSTKEYLYKEAIADLDRNCFPINNATAKE